MEKKIKLPVDIRRLIRLTFSYILLLVIFIITKVPGQRIEVFTICVSVILIIISALTIIFRRMGWRKFGESDERERQVKERARSITLRLIVFILVIYSFISFTNQAFWGFPSGYFALILGGIYIGTYLITRLILNYLIL
ncbi:MAG: hypothetical protein ABSG94_12715 [Brevinematales bacterium]|jgi:uncharacterized membrane protein